MAKIQRTMLLEPTAYDLIESYCKNNKLSFNNFMEQAGLKLVQELQNQQQ